MTYRDAKDYDKALEALQQALVLARSLSDDKFFSPNYGRDFSEIPIQIDLSFIYEKLRDYPKVLAAAQRSLELSHGVDFESGPGYAFLLMSNVYLAQKEYQQALNASSQALQTFRQKLTLGSMDAIALSNMGKAYAGLKQYPKAIEIYSSALERMRKRGDRQGEARTLYLTAVTERDRGNLKAARTNIEAGLAIVEDLRTKVVDPQLRTSYFASVQEYYQFYIDLLMQLHKQQPKQGFDALALQASERARARSLLELLNEAHADIRQGVDPKLLEQEKTLQQQFSSLEKRRIQVLSGNPTPEQAAALDQDYKALQNQYQQNQEQIRRTSPRYAALTQAQPLTLAEIQQQVLDDNTLLLVYSLGNDRSYLWAVTKTGMSSYVLPKQEDISKLAKQVYSLFTDKRHDFVKAELDQASAQLSQILLSPVTSQLGQKRLVVIADGALQYLPFTALPIPQGTGKTGTSAAPLLTQHELINLPSASTLAILRRDTQGRKSAPKTVAVMADPVFSKDDPRLKAPSKGTAQETLVRSTLTRSATQTGVSFSRLENTRLEAEAIAKLVPADQQRSDLGFAANLTNATSPQLSQYRMVHFATHGLLNSETPELSGVVLSLVTEKGGTENGFLRLQEIFNLNLPADLVVLSACKTGLGKEIQGEGLIGLTRGFMYAGAPRVVVSLWNVDDKATALLMSEFYRGMLEKRLTPAVALRQAQQSLMQQSEYRAPYYWAAFTLQGEWK
jgi:CHAT domain-containing protein